jgi:hypothetical protein
MMKRMAIVGLLACGLVGGAWPQIPGNGSGQRDKAQNKQETANPPKPVVAVESPTGANNQDKTAEKSAKYPWGELLAPANIPNWFLVLVGTVTGWFVYKTLRAIKKQADIMEVGARDARESGAEATRIALATAKAARKAADAAEMSAKAAMGVAVPVLVLQELQFENHGGTYEGLFKYPTFRISVKNFGQSPAFLKSYAVVVATDDLPPQPIYPKAPWPCDMHEVVDAGAQYTLGGSDGRTATNDPVDDETLRILVARMNAPVVYGFVTYRDVFGASTHTMKFSKVFFEIESDGTGTLAMDWGGEEYTG